MVKRGRSPGAGRWSIPGGRVEAGESLARAVERELLEETGVRGRCEGVLGCLERRGPGYHFVILDFSVSVVGGDEPTPGDDATEAAWVPLSDVWRLDLVDGLGRFLEDHGVLAPGSDPAR